MPLIGLAGLAGGPFRGGIDPGIETPSIISPEYNTDILVNPITFVSTPFEGQGSVNTHVSSQWQISPDNTFNSLVVDETSTTDLTSLTVSTLSQGQSYYIRVRYNGESPERTSEWSIPFGFKLMGLPVVSWVTDTPSSWNPTAGDNRTFSATATDTANPGGVHNTYTYQWYRNGSPASGYTGQNFAYYNPVYYNDSGSSFYCRVTITNAVGSTSSNSTTCNISVTRNVRCEDAVQIHDIRFSGSGGKPGGGTSTWGEYRLPKNYNGTDLSNLCEVSWEFYNSLRARARPGRCPNGYKLTLEFSISGAGIDYPGRKISQDAGDGNYGFFNPEGAQQLAANGSEPVFRVKHIGGMSYSRCNSPPDNTPDIQPEQDGDAMGFITCKTRQYQYETRP